MVPIERALVRSVLWLAAGLGISVLLLFVPASADPSTIFLIHLSLLVLFGLGLSIALVDLSGADWFAGSGWTASARLWASGIGLIVLATGVVGLVTLASSAALRFDPSTQFLQLISALDIAWVTAAVVIGCHRLWGRLIAGVAGLGIGLFCVWSIWRYIEAVGFGASGEWIVSGEKLMTLVLPYDMAAAVLAIALFALGARRAAQAIEQPSAQS